MRFVPVKSEEQQAIVTLHRSRAALVQQKTKTANVLRSLCAEFGLIAAKGRRPLGELVRIICNDGDRRLPAEARMALKPLVDILEHLHRHVVALEREIVRIARADERCRRLESVPGVGPITASALVATVGDAARFKSSRDLAAWIGLTRRANATGGKDRGGPISKQGDRHLRQLFVQGAAAVVKVAASPRSRSASPWLCQLLERKSRKLAIVAQANKTARIAWAVLTRGEYYRADHARTAA
jgi:transposase